LSNLVTLTVRKLLECCKKCAAGCHSQIFFEDCGGFTLMAEGETALFGVGVGRPPGHRAVVGGGGGRRKNILINFSVMCHFRTKIYLWGRTNLSLPTTIYLLLPLPR
jgi:hypothetical protein